MIDVRPIGYVIGLLLAFLGASMLIPAAMDLVEGSENWRGFALSAGLTGFVGLSVALACAETRRPGLTLQQTFLLTVLIWVALPIFGALPFVLGAPGARYVDAFFEAMSGLTTTGSTVFTGLDQAPAGFLLWRALLQWFGGLGIIVVALAFLPNLRVGGMQLFKSEAFDTFGKILPRAAEIASSLWWIYVALTIACAVVYSMLGMNPFDAVTHAMTTISTGGFANYDASFGYFAPSAEYSASIFMLLAALPFPRYIQLATGRARPILRDSQVRAFAAIVVSVVAALTLYRVFEHRAPFEESFRESLFNTISVMSGTGYSSVDYGAWGAFPVAVFFLIGLIGGCAGSTSCSIKVFRFQIVVAAIGAQIQRIHSPHGIFNTRYEGKPVTDDLIASVMSFLYLFALTYVVGVVALSMIGLDTITAISGAATALANIGPGLGDIIGPAGNFGPLPDSAKWVLSALMLLGRLELLSVFVLFTVAFWRA